jgi:bla regulator protein blaR1
MNFGAYLLGSLKVLDAHPGLAFFLELGLKAALLLLLAFLAGWLLRKATVARRHLLWCLCILALSCLPALLGAMPKLALGINADSPLWVPGPETGLSQAWHANIEHWWQVLLQVYLWGLFVLLLFTFSGLLRMLLLNRQASASAAPLAQQVLGELLAEELADINVSLREHPALVSPLSWGLLQPVIILPAASRVWPEDRLRHVLLHELGHIQRLDWITQLAGRYVCALYWYNPLAWLATRRMCELAEQACDDAVLLQAGRNADYAAALVSLAGAASETHSRHYLAQAMAGSFLGSRVLAILDNNRARSVNDSVWVIRSVLLVFLLTALLAALTVTQVTAPFAGSAAPGSFFSVQFLPARMSSMVELPQSVALPSPPPVPDIRLAALETVIIQAPVLPAATVDLREAAEVSLLVIDLAELPVAGFGALEPFERRFPAYPRAAEQRGIEGHATIEYELSAEGQVRNPVVLESSPGGIFEQSALHAIRGYRYTPPTVNGTPVGIKGLRTRFVYRLNPDPG